MAEGRGVEGPADGDEGVGIEGAGEERRVATNLQLVDPKWWWKFPDAMRMNKNV